MAWRSFAPLVGPDNVYSRDWEDNLHDDSYLFAWGDGPGLVPNATLEGVTSTTTYHATGVAYNAVFTTLFGSYAGDWNMSGSDGNVLRESLGMPGKALTVTYSGYFSDTWVFHPMGLGEPIGSSLATTQNNVSSVYQARNNGYFRPIVLSLLGDPTLRMTTVLPVTGVSTTWNGSATVVSWSDSSSRSYDVYRAESALGPFTKLTTSGPITESSYSDSYAATHPGAYVYMVRAIQEQTTASGTFIDGSEGVFSPLTIIGDSSADTISVSMSSDNIQVSRNASTIFSDSASLISGIYIDGLAGNDSLSVSSGVSQNATIDGDGGNDSITGGGGDDVVYGGADDDAIIVGGAGNDTIDGGAGDDSFDFPSGTLASAAIDGGDGVDTVRGVSGPDDDQFVEYFLTVDGNNVITVTRCDVDNGRLFTVTQTSSGATTAALVDTGFGIEVDAYGTLTSGFYDETVPVNNVTSLLVNGRNESEFIDVEANINVTINAGGGNDTIIVQAPHATIYGGAGDDDVYTGNTGDYYIDLDQGYKTLHGGNGVDSVLLQSGGIDSIWLGGGDDFIDVRGDSSNDDYINGGSGFDTMIIWAGAPGRSGSMIESIEYYEES